MNEAKMALTDLKPCEQTLRVVGDDFTKGVALWHENHYDNAIEYFASALNEMAKGVDSCGLAKQLEFIQQEANVLGIGNVTAIGGVVQVLVHGSDFYEEIYQAAQDFANHDYRKAGGEFTKVMNQLSEWTTGHLCTSPACYIVSGALQY